MSLINCLTIYHIIHNLCFVNLNVHTKQISCNIIMYNNQRIVEDYTRLSVRTRMYNCIIVHIFKFIYTYVMGKYIWIKL